MQASADETFRLIVQRTAELQSRLGKELGTRPLVLANGKFFPDKFTQDLSSVTALLRRMQAHAGMLDVPLEVALVGGPAPKATGCGPTASGPTATTKKHVCQGNCGKHAPGNSASGNSASGDSASGGCAGCDGSCHHEHAADHHAEAHHEESTASANAEEVEGEDSQASAGGSCGSGGCGTGCGTPPVSTSNEPRLVDLGSSWRVQVPAAELSHPVALTTNLARTLGVVFLAETTSAPSSLGEDLEVTAEMVGSLLGFSALLLAGSYLYSKSCGGPKIGRVTALGPAELALVAVLFARRNGHDLRPLARDLEPTQKDALRSAIDWLDERPAIAERFRNCPEQLARGDIPLSPAKVGLMARLFGKKPSASPTSLDAEPSLEQLEAVLSQDLRPAAKRPAQPADPRAAELRALVDEAFQSTGASPE